MFKKLRNQLIRLNLSMITVMMLVAFSSIYIITYQDTHNNIQEELHRVADFEGKGNRTKPPYIGPLPSGDNGAGKNENKESDSFSNRAISFTIVIDENEDIIDTFSFFDIDESFVQSAKVAALKDGDETGQFEINQTHWAYMVNEGDDGVHLVFIDVTSQQAVLTRLIYTFIGVAIVMLLVIYLISRYLTNKSIEPIRLAFDKQKQFIADASHELKTPLSVINTNVDVLMAQGLDESHSKWLTYIKYEAERMSKLTNDLLYLAQVDHSEIKLIDSDFNLSDTVENALLTMEATIYEKGLTLDYEIEPNLMFHGNSEQLIQVVMILLDNAMKYSNEKGTITLGLMKQNHHIHLSVTNTGAGISPEHLDKIFDRFYRMDAARTHKTGSYGLGLSIAKTIVEQHGGKITVDSVVGEKTTFTVKF